MNTLQKLFRDEYSTILNRNEYNQGLRQYVYSAYKGKYYSDCSSSICATMNRIGVSMPLLNTAGMYHSKLWQRVPVRIEAGRIHQDDIHLLRVGDALLFRGSDSSRPLQIGHVEAVYEVNGVRDDMVTICGHGSGKPSLKNLRKYLVARESSKAPNGKTKGLVCVIRAIEDKPSRGGEWVRDGENWKYLKGGKYVKGAWERVAGRDYVFDEAGRMITGWFNQGTDWYYLNPADGAMLSGQWVEHKGQHFYLCKNGKLAKNCYVKPTDKDMYYWVDDKGVWKEEHDTSTPDLTKYALAE